MSKFCFLLPAYKSSFLEESLRSIFNQSFTDYTIIVSDDCSPEPIRDIINLFSSKQNLVYRRNDVNIGAKGLVSHWNLLLDLCDSDYLIIAGDDDRYHPRFLETVNSLIDNNPKIVLFSVGLNVIDADNNVKTTYSEGQGLISFDCFVKHFVDPSAILCMGNYVFRTKTLKESGGFVDFPMAWKSDSASQILMAKKGVVTSSQILFDFRMSGKNLSSRVAPNSESDSLKLESIFSFDRWAKTNCYPYISDDTIKNIRRKFEGELRMYLWTQSVSSIFRIFSQLNRDNWFMSFRNKLSFIYCCIKAVFGYCE